MILHYLKTAFRNLQRNKLSSILIIGGFAVGFTVCIIIGLYTYSEFSVDKRIKDHERIYRVIDVNSKFIKGNTTALDYNLGNVLKSNYSELEQVAPYNIHSSDNSLLLTENKSFKYDYSMNTTDEIFDLLSLKIVERSKNGNLLDKNSVVLTKSMADKMFKGVNAIGKSVVIDDMQRKELFVSAIVEDLPQNTSFPNISVFVNIERNMQWSQMERDGYSVKPVSFFLKLNPNVNTLDFTNKLNSSLKNYQKIHDNVQLQPLSDIYLYSAEIQDNNNTKNGNTKLILLLDFIAVLILVLSIINYISYSIAQHQSQIKNIGIRKTNGASFSDIFKYFLAESFLGAILATAISLSLISFFNLLPFASQLLGSTIRIGLLFQPALFLFFIFILCSIMFINTIILQWGLINFDLQKYLRRNNIKSNGLATNVLSVTQFTVAIGLLICLIIINKQLHFAKHSDLGFQKESIIHVKLNGNLKLAKALKSEIDKLPFVQSSSVSQGIPGIINARTEDGYLIYADNNFINTYDIKMLENWKAGEGKTDKICIVNEMGRRKNQWKESENPKFWDIYTVAGVMKDFKFMSFRESVTPVIIVIDQTYINNLPNYSVRLSAGNLSFQLSEMKKAWKTVMPDEYPMEFEFIDDRFKVMYAKDEQLGEAISSFSTVAFILVMLGILGQVSQICNNKTKEIGIRKVNGARLTDVLKIINKRFVIWVLAALITASPIAFLLMKKWLENFAYKTTLDWWVFVLAGALTFTFVVTIVTLQSWSTVRKNPVDALRYE
jgi:putative ABC transport system permease protein